MNIKAIDANVEAPEAKDGVYSIRSAERIDVRPGETINVYTGLEALAYHTDEAVLNGPNTTRTKFYTGRGYDELTVPVVNASNCTMHIKPGQVIAQVTFKPEESEEIVEITTSAEFTENASE